jgi:hypothetical protein
VTFGHRLRRLLESLDRPTTLDHTLFMLASWIGRGTVFFIAVSVLLLFFFPLAQGPFQATNGPTTTFRAHIVFLILILLLVHSALGMLVPFSKWTRTRINNGLLGWDPTSSSLTVVAQFFALRC